jgi:hypothetical protein
VFFFVQKALLSAYLRIILYLTLIAMRILSILFLCEFLVLSPLCAQVTNPEQASVHKDVKKASPTTTLRADYYFPKGSYLYWEGNYNFNKEYTYLTNGYRVYNQIGYEHAATSFWYIGASAKHQLAYTAPNTLVAKANITHRGKIGSFGFIKELSGEYIYTFPNSTAGATAKQPTNARGSLSVGLYKQFNIAKRPLITSLFYRVYLNTNMGEIYKNRRFDFIKFRLDISYGITKNIYAGLYGMLDSEHYYTLASTTYDASGNLIESIPDYRQNRINPVVGFSLNFIFRQEGFDKEKEILPGLPFR